MFRPEILAPAGGQQQLLAAVRCGADAVYLGAGSFNARRNAENFGEGSLADAVSYCHARGVAVHVTVNTLIMDDELDALEETAAEIAASGADAVITQDLAVMRLFRDRCPSIQRHASTQMSIHNLDGALLMADLGFDRVVLARELSLREIEKITARCGIETEIFVHGALCMSISGGCYLSSMLGGRSGNRGLCAQPCRLDFRCGNKDHALSLKDMSLLEHMAEIKAAGVASLKIEGRMKRPEYVAAAVTACRQAVDGEKYDADSLRSVFSRSGFTDGYLTGKRTADMFGYRRHEDVTAAEGVLGQLAGLYRAERKSIPVDMRLELTQDRSLLTARSESFAVTVTGEIPQKALNRPTDELSARRNLEKTGGTPFSLEKLEFESAGNLMLPAAALNSLRREALEKLLEKQAAPTPHEFLPDKPVRGEKRAAAPFPQLWGRFEKYDQIGSVEGLSRVILPVEEIAANPHSLRRFAGMLVGEVPPLLFESDAAGITQLCSDLYENGLREIYTDNAYGIHLGNELGFLVRGGHGLNILNSRAVEEYENLGLISLTVSFEAPMKNIAALGGSAPLGLLAYGRLPLMRFRACPARGKAGCGDCRGRPVLTDRKGVDFTLLCHDRKFGSLLNSVPLDIADRSIAPVDFMTLYFTTETPEETETVIRRFREKLPSSAPRTGGLYYRRIQ